MSSIYSPFNPNVEGLPVNRMNEKGLPFDSGMPMSNFTPRQTEPSNNFIPQNMNMMPPAGPEMYGLGSGRFEDSEIQFKLDGARILNEIQHSLLGEVYDISDGRFKRVSKPMLSQEGVGKIVQILSFSIANVDHRLTKLGIDSINISCKETRNNLRKQLMLDEMYRPNPSIPLTVADIRVILEEVCQCKESLLKRSLDGFTVNKSGYQETHQYMHQDPNQQQSGGFMPKFFK